MALRILSRGAIAAVVGATMLAASSAPSPAFTLSSPSLEQPVVHSDVESVWWHGGWHRGWHGGWHRGWVAAGVATDDSADDAAAALPLSSRSGGERRESIKKRAVPSCIARFFSSAQGARTAQANTYCLLPFGPT